MVVLYVSRSLLDGLRMLGAQPLDAPVRWDLLALSGTLTLTAHVILIETWRRMLTCWNERIPFWSAARVWSVSNLAKYLPGPVWQIGAMGAMSREIGVSPMAASGAALLSAMVSVIAGFVVVLASGRGLLEQAHPGWATLAGVIAVCAIVGLIAAPAVLPRIGPAIARLAGRQLETTLPARAVVYSAAGNLVAWLLYGAAFNFFVRGLIGGPSGGYLAYLAAYTVAYLTGYLSFFTVAGAGTRELVMQRVLVDAHLASVPQAALITISSRVWLTLLEVTPAILFWVHHRMRPRSPTTDPTDVPT
ncbi:MAG: hypothetical protein JWM95_3988 [Gemmatimonadetes bacterium]|nr:hypothetical protein [Gemmatimonadota bacterium]